MIRLRVNSEDADQRLDTYVVSRLQGESRSFVQKLTNEGKVTVGGNKVKSGYKVREHDDIRIDYDMDEANNIPEISMPILYEDEDCIIINKPPGVLTHSKGGFIPEATVASFIKNRVVGLTGNRAGIVHRLDRATSGVIICAKHPQALSWLQKQFSQRKVKKQYAAIVSGVPKREEAIVNMPIERNPARPQTFRVGHGGKDARTHYVVTRSDGRYSLLDLHPETGRTHQLRVHMAKIGCPIIGDTIYGGEPAQRLFLHAVRLEITLPDGEKKVFTTKLPDEFNVFIRKIQNE